MSIIQGSDVLVTVWEQAVLRYLDSFMETTSDTSSSVADDSPFRRMVCCDSSRSLYCQRCCRLLVPEHLLPTPISHRRMTGNEGEQLVDNHPEGRPITLPFHLHIILDDRRGSATGLHAVALMNGQLDNNIITKDHVACTQSCVPLKSDSVMLIDLATDKMPKYQDSDGSTFLLFPSPGESVPLAHVASKVRTLVVLDCKWTKSKICRQDKDLLSLQKVHLSSPPQQSAYWRWHNAGPCMLSTIEAIYYAAIEVMQKKHEYLLEKGEISISDSENDQNNLIHLLWLFGHQRAATFKSAQTAGIPAPCTDEGKEKQRAMRKQKGTWRQLRHKEDQRRLFERMSLRCKTCICEK